MAGHRRKRSLEPPEDGGGSARLPAPPGGVGQETRAWSAPQERVSRLCPSRSNSGAYGTPPPRARGRSEHGVCSSEACGIPAPMHRWGDQGEEEVGKACPRWVVTRDVARTLVSLLHSWVIALSSQDWHAE